MINRRIGHKIKHNHEQNLKSKMPLKRAVPNWKKYGRCETKNSRKSNRTAQK